jgi:hypothetical protein
MKKNIFDLGIFDRCAEGSPIPSPTPIIPQDKIDQGLPVNTANDGVMHTRVPQPRVIYDKADNEKVISNENAYIVFGTDRPSTKASGFGGQGAISDTIDIVVGRLSSGRGGKGACDDVYTGNNFAADAARIYISKLTDVDTNFGIATEVGVEPKARSAIAIKADQVRIIGREGVKIVTGGMQGVTGYGLKGETNSRGGRLSDQAPRIDLIAGNNTGLRRVWGGIFNPIDKIEFLQPVTKGDNMVRCLEELSDFLDKLLAAVLNMAIYTTLGFTAIGTAAAIRSKTVHISPSVLPAVALIQTWVSSPLYMARVAKTTWEFNYLNSNAHRYICSRNVRAT